MPDFFNLLVKQCLIIQQIFDYPVSFSLLNSHIFYNTCVKLVLQFLSVLQRKNKILQLSRGDDRKILS